MGSVLRSELRRSEFLRVVQAAGLGDEVATNQLVTHCLPQISNYLSRRGAAHPDALANQVMSEFIRNLPRLDFKSQERAWSYLYSVARSRLLDEKRMVRLEQPSDCIDGADIRHSSFDDEVVTQLWLTDLLANLTDDQRRVVELRFREDLTLEQTAKRTGKTVTAVKGLQRRALAALAAAAAVAAAVILVLLAVKFVQNPGINIQSLQPADVSERRDAPSEGRGTGEIKAEAGEPTGETNGPADAGGIGGRSPVQVGPGSDGRGMGNSQPVDDGTGFGIGTGTGSGTGALTTTPVPSSTAAPAATTSAPAGSSTTTPSTVVPIAPISPISDDTVHFTSAPFGPTWIDIDVLANDDPSVDQNTLRIATPFTAGHADVVVGTDGPVLRYYPTGPGQPTGQYEVCGAEGCNRAQVSVSVTWYSETLCSTLTPTIIGTPGDDILQGTVGPDIIFGLGGDDQLTGAAGNDILCGGDGNDLIFGEAGSDIIFGGSGNDDLSGDDETDAVYGGTGDDTIFGLGGADQLYGGSGTDIIYGGGQQDAIYGEAGPDTIFAGGSGDNVFGGLGDDWLNGAAGNDLLRGGPGRDTLVGGDGTDRLLGNSAEDNMSEGIIFETGDGPATAAPGGGASTTLPAGGGGNGTIVPSTTVPYPTGDPYDYNN